MFPFLTSVRYVLSHLIYAVSHLIQSCDIHHSREQTDTDDEVTCPITGSGTTENETKAV